MILDLCLAKGRRGKGWIIEGKGGLLGGEMAREGVGEWGGASVSGVMVRAECSGSQFKIGGNL